MVTTILIFFQKPCLLPMTLVCFYAALALKMLFIVL
jgi:hypothetical protein